MDHVDEIIAQWRHERPDLATGPMATLGRLKRLADHLSEGLNSVFAANGLTSASFDVLATLRRSGQPYALSPSELIGWTMVSSGTMTNRLDRLEAAGLILRQPNPHDGRGSVVALSPQGFALIDRVVGEHVTNQHRLMQGLSPELHAQLDVGLTAWLALFEGPDSVRK